jgi:hypothetical protein
LAASFVRWLLPPSYPTFLLFRYSALERGDLIEKYAKALDTDLFS